ncbi:transporter substrate-binding domain-containing protein [Desulfitobacterium chlororespirans]|uniref:Amino acid ABC transporter substrate-binding protein, PAAT family n=1 Tax=Desulfitobacterium chlororespirans DSM 11544 TaxID=1121395 RepID=A0A1M7SX91_9FIRM|nr:transporter substrate-binding domain-containing protein [Desulfitobacterium chlororespirans]SHN63026.1 amino acid ABC transporter substrate-binding protein, PAAT family [Desulfitobacterium chlororespirans DSM 11544]
MKKLGIFLASLFLIGSLLAGCGSSPAQPPAQSGGGSESNVPADIQAIKDRGVLSAGVKIDVPGFGYKDPKTNVIDGFEIDLVKALAEEIFGDPNKIKLQAVTAKTRGPLLDSGDVDMVVATFTITEDRKKSYNFSDPYYIDSVGLLVKKAPGYKGLKDLDGKNIGVAQSATSKTALQAEADKLGIKVKFQEFATYPEIKAALDSGRVDAFSVDRSILLGYIDDSTMLLDDKFSPQEYGVASKLGNDGLAKLVNDKIDEMQGNGELQKLIEKWGL